MQKLQTWANDATDILYRLHTLISQADDSIIDKESRTDLLNYFNRLRWSVCDLKDDFRHPTIWNHALNDIVSFQPWFEFKINSKGMQVYIPYLSLLANHFKKVPTFEEANAQ